MQFRDYIYARHSKGDYDVLYELSDRDVTGAVNKYYGYLSAEGEWIIQRWDTSADSYRYCIGESDYATNWTARAALSYVLYSAL